MIWHDKNISLKELEQWSKNTMSELLDIHFTEIGNDFLKATMPVDNRTIQPYGLLHGGASATLAETVGSVASALIINREKQMCVGLEINANHIRSARNGLVTAIAKPLHLGATTHVWDIKITDEKEKLICVSRLTVAVLNKKNNTIH
ncbi:MAG: hotdog fold thioesterase [Chitinophagaceae bacterium]|nr:hotdog fold thioesterase [Chitinophagaceae bacterium]